MVGFALIVYLRNISSLSVPCISFLSMHALFNISSISVACTYLYPCTCLSLVCHSCTFGTLALSYSCTITVCLTLSLICVTVGCRLCQNSCFFLVILMKNASVAKYWSMFSKIDRCLVKIDRCLVKIDRCLVKVDRCLVNVDRCLVNVDRSLVKIDGWPFLAKIGRC